MIRPLFLPVLCFMAGILAAGSAGFTVPVSIMFVILALFLLLLTGLIGRQRLFYSLLCVFFFLLGAYRYTDSTAPGKNDIGFLATAEPQKVLLYGTVSAEPQSKGVQTGRYQSFPLKVECIVKNPGTGTVPKDFKARITGTVPSRIVKKNEEEKPVSGTVLVKLFDTKEHPRIGDRLAIKGKLSLPPGKTNPAGFDYKTYLGRMGTRVILTSSGKSGYKKTGEAGGPVTNLRRAISKTADRADGIIKSKLSGVTRAVTRSVILGRRNGIDDDTEDAFVKTGTMHILAVSGLHTGIVALVIMAALSGLRAPKKAAYILTVLGVFAFAVFTGSRPSSMRAAIMAAFVIASLSLHQKTDIVNALALSAFAITFFRPGRIYDTGFVLSYTAVLSIIFITPLTDTFLGIKQMKLKDTKIERAKRVLLKSISVSLAVWLGMMPITAACFRIITPSVVISNLIAIPALFVMVILGFVLLLAGAVPIFSPIAWLASRALSAIVPFFIGLMRTFSKVPLSYARVSAPDIFTILLFYAALIAAIVLFHRKQKPRYQIVMFFLFAANIFVWNEIHQKPPETLQATFFNTGKSDASFLEFPDGTSFLIDGGASGQWSGRNIGRDVIAPYLWQRGIRKIDAIMLTHSHEDHVGGLPYILENFGVGTVIDNGTGTSDNPKEQELYEKFKDLLVEKQITTLTCGRGDVLNGFRDIKLMVFNPPKDSSHHDPNSDSIVIKALTKENNGIIFCADAGSVAAIGMLPFGSLLRADIIKVPHHGGSMGDMTVMKAFFKEVDSRYMVITNRNKSKLSKSFTEYLKGYKGIVNITGSGGAVTFRETPKGWEIDAK